MRHAFCLLLVLLLSRAASAAPSFVGRFTDGSVTVEIAPDGDALGGQILRGGRRYPLKAHREADQVVGTFDSDQTDFPFTATLRDDALTFTSGGATYTLKRVSAERGNPLDDATDHAAESRRFDVLAATDAGATLAVRTPRVKSAADAIAFTLSELASTFDAAPVVDRAFSDTKSESGGGASFHAMWKGAPVNGLILCKSGKGGVGADVVVTYCRTNATKEQWSQLATAAPKPVSVEDAGAPIALKDHAFPDGTGTVGLADGWTTDSPSCADAVAIKGPADQFISIGVNIPVSTPDAPMIVRQRQIEAVARQRGQPMPPFAKTLVAPLCAPADALTTLVPQMSEINRSRGSGPFMEIAQITSDTPVEAGMPSGKASVLSYTVKRTLNGVVSNRKAVARVETAPIAPGTWMMSWTEVAAPEETFERDAPLMIAMAGSVKGDPQRIGQVKQAQTDALLRQGEINGQRRQENAREFQRQQDERFAKQQDMHREQLAGYAKHNEQFKLGQIEKARHNDDVVEMLRGWRDVEDTRTGERTSVDYFNVDAIVEKWNEPEPGRYKPLLLRDEKDPLPNHGDK